MGSSVLHLDMSKNATRGEIFLQVDAALENDSYSAMNLISLDKSIPPGKHFHNLAEVSKAIEGTPSSAKARDLALRIYRTLAEAEAEVHGVDVAHTHFHEVGLGSSVRQVLGICTAISVINPSFIVSTPVQVGSGIVECAHGALPIPAPATAAIIKRYQIPLCEEKLEGELCTPTSAAILSQIVNQFER